MSVYQCEECGCMENSALGFYWAVDSIAWPSKYKGRKLCSACGPTTFPGEGTKTKWGQWHGRFDRVFFPKGLFITDRFGNLKHKVTGETDVRKYAIATPFPQ